MDFFYSVRQVTAQFRSAIRNHRDRESESSWQQLSVFPGPQLGAALSRTPHLRSVISETKADDGRFSKDTGRCLFDRERYVRARRRKDFKTSVRAGNGSDRIK